MHAPFCSPEPEPKQHMWQCRTEPTEPPFKSEGGRRSVGHFVNASCRRPCRGAGGRGEVRGANENYLFTLRRRGKKGLSGHCISPYLSPSLSFPLLRVLSVFIVHRKYCCRRVSVSLYLRVPWLLHPPCLPLYKVAHEYRVDLTVIRTFLYCSHILLLFQNHFSQRVIRPTEMPSHECTKMSEIACFALKSSVLTLLALRASSARHHAPSCLCLPSYPFSPFPLSHSCLSASPVRPSLSLPLPPSLSQSICNVAVAAASAAVWVCRCSRRPASSS